MLNGVVATNYEIEERALNQTVATHPRISSDLPALKIDTSSWLEDLFKEINKLKEEFQRWLEAHFKPIDSQIDFKSIMQFIFYAVIAMLLAFALFHIITFIQKKIRSKSSGSAQNRMPGQLDASANDRLQRQIRESIQAGEWAKASRLRWRLFLLRKKFPEVMTPREYFIMTRDSQLPQADQQYRNMFSKGVAGRDWYASYNQSLDQLES